MAVAAQTGLERRPEIHARSWSRVACWTSIALAGQVLQVSAIDAGKALRYQHYTSLAALWEGRPWIVWGLLLQAVIVGAALRSFRLPQSARGWRIAAAVSLFVLTSATVSADIRRYLAELPFAALVQGLNLAALVLLVRAIPEQACRKFNERAGAMLRSRRVPVLMALLVAIAAALLNWAVYDRHPHLQDEVAYLYHARLLAAGKLALPVPPVPEAFQTYLFEDTVGRWYPVTPLGWPALLAVGAWLEAPWLVNPVLAGICILLLHALLSRVYDRWVAGLGVILTGTSPWFVFLGMSFMNHTAVLACELAAALGVWKAVRSGRLAWAFVASLPVGLCSLVRPLDGLILASLLAVWLLSVRRLRVKLLGTGLLGAGAALAGALVLPYNLALTGDPLRFPLNAYTDRLFGPGTNAMGFGANRGLGWALDPFPGHGPLDALVNANLNITATNSELFGWSTGSLIFIIVLVVWGKPLASRADRAMWALAAAVPAAYSLYYFSGGPDFGARYWFAMLPALIVLSVRGVQSFASERVLLAVFVLCALSAMVFFPWRAFDKYAGYLGMNARIRDLVSAGVFGANDLVFVRGKAFPDYSSAMTYNPLDWNARVPLFVWDRSPEVRTRLEAAFPDRRKRILNGPSVTGGSFELAQ